MFTLPGATTVFREISLGLTFQALALIFQRTLTAGVFFTDKEITLGLVGLHLQNATSSGRRRASTSARRDSRRELSSRETTLAPTPQGLVFQFLSAASLLLPRGASLVLG